MCYLKTPYLLTRISISSRQFRLRIAGISSKVMIHKSFCTVTSPSHARTIQKP
ncbi:hypothetical protein HanXRQr2_Chr16g0747371 [Helianthus annuus]|uniref:Uncharacterized protein n=1 Tax=Helianthus annuus TaxID=4232 RepID=A0A9K3DQU9_HELAN|nr:hypothetical protein HanXRQr2_Chr16g0747371 [Helianthus annuus]KAJ0442674.1 hypothetical protein HanIR_Chr16g0812121 [Helianthus annuus]KAJ0821136.1 hypothetical protein HanPSC8_Chr16g0716481 [Helianthus annuus]